VNTWRTRHPALSFVVVAGCWLGLAAASADETSQAALERWLEHQSTITSWTAEIVQTRRLRSLVRPLESAGRVWFVQPSRFRWQLGDPPRTIAIRAHNELVILYPRLRQAERYAAGEHLDQSWQQALDLLEVGFPSDPGSFLSRYELMSASHSEGVWTFELRPAAKAARRLLEGVRIEVSDDRWMLVATELVFPDGSVMRNAFSHHVINPDLEGSLFAIDIPEGYEVVEPLDGR